VRERCERPRIRADAAPVGLRSLPHVALLNTRALLIVNPASRRGAQLQERATAAFAAAGVAVDVVVTSHAGHGATVVRSFADSHERIFTLGGDGTAMEVIDALSGTGRAVGVLAGGTGNLLARALGIPLQVERAVASLLAGRVRAIDLGRLAHGRHFAVAAGVGIDVAMIAGASQQARRRYGVLAYVRSATAAILARDTFAVRATVDGRTFEMERCVGAMVANVGTILNGLMVLGPGIVPDDGRLDLCLFGAAGTTDVLTVLRKMAFRDFRPDHRLVFARGESLTIDTDRPRTMEADGELLGDTPLRVAVVPRSAPLLVPTATWA
jgi:diacylglycerol kinase (ATP)